EGAPDELRQRVTRGARVLVEVKAAAEAVAKAIRAIEGISAVETTSHDGWCLAAATPKDGRDVREAIGHILLNNKWTVRELRYESASLEQFFVQITASQSQAAEPAAA